MGIFFEVSSGETILYELWKIRNLNLWKRWDQMRNLAGWLTCSWCTLHPDFFFSTVMLACFANWSPILCSPWLVEWIAHPSSLLVFWVTSMTVISYQIKAK